MLRWEIALWGRVFCCGSRIVVLATWRCEDCDLWMSGVWAKMRGVSNARCARTQAYTHMHRQYRDTVSNTDTQKTHNTTYNALFL
mmetsp:Transcript_57449/g.84284  ORF Transcript_57449/g.84284 Transcript_57449/m.84284 type:complete len:85 (-) Transcript_57449:51-305(-)